MRKNLKTLILNSDFRPLAVTSAQKAFILVYKFNVSVVEYYNDEKLTDSKGHTYPVPAVVRTRTYIKETSRKIVFNRKNILWRDKLRCQYCGKKYKPEELTYDHVIPRIKWKNQEHKGRSPTTWANIVAACKPCNARKADRTPKEAGMPLKFGQPREPRVGEVVVGFNPFRDKAPEEWKLYLTESLRSIMDEEENV